MNMRILQIFFVSLLLASCAAAATKPMCDLTVSYDESAPPEWKLGWQHGCESGLSAYGNNYYKTLYKFHQDITMIKNEYYFKAWTDAFNFCRSSVNRSLGGDMKQREDVPSLMSTNNLDITKGSKGDNATIVKQGLFGTDLKEERGLFSDMFDVKSPGYGSMSWGHDPYNGKCDWLNRCGNDIPKDPMNALMGQ
jgi:hypothetical protein